MISDEAIGEFYSAATLRHHDLFSAVKPLLDDGSWHLTDEGKVTQRYYRRGDHNTPWVHVRQCPVRVCRRHHSVLFRCFGVIPRMCFDCYKVVVRPRTVIELFKLLEVLRQLPAGMPSKCGAEVRDYVPADYGGYVYALGLDEGRERHRTVREAVSEKISAEVPVTLKRACTEFELRYGDSDRWQYNPAWQQIEEWVDGNFLFPPVPAEQPEAIRVSVMRSWLSHAHGRGDLSYLKLTGGEPLSPLPVTWEEREEGEKESAGGQAPG